MRSVIERRLPGLVGVTERGIELTGSSKGDMSKELATADDCFKNQRRFAPSVGKVFCVAIAISGFNLLTACLGGNV